MQEDEQIIRARVEGELKQAFEEACAKNYRTASQVIRELMRNYVKENSQSKLIKKKTR